MGRKKSCELEFVDKVLVHNLQTGFVFFLQKSHRSSEWEIAWGENAWPANSFAVERFYRDLSERIEKRKIGEDLSQCNYEITIFSREAPRNVKLNAEALFFGADAGVAASKLSDDMIIVSFLNPRIFSHVKDECKIFKIKSDDGEFVFAKRNGRWFLDNLTAHLEVSSDSVANFFREIFALEGTDVCQSYENPGKNDLSVTLYGNNASEKVDFFSGDGDLFLLENSATDIYFFAEREKYYKIMEAAENLLKFRIFRDFKCEDMTVVLVASDEHFNFHDLKTRNMWQLTYSKKGKLRVEEISKEQVAFLFEMFDKVEAIGVVYDLGDESNQFTVILDRGTDHARTFNFCEVEGRLFVGLGDQNIKFEIKSSFATMFFQILRSHSAKSEDIVL
ncbi:MAG: hypothetical protein LBI56_01820 [Puniceicoccales bacterium]|jgi:hypothetical protein|nr:hypothetical protein [Puniceicoccales bacterium]